MEHSEGLPPGEVQDRLMQSLKVSLARARQIRHEAREMLAAILQDRDPRRLWPARYGLPKKTRVVD